jgi:alpha-glucoside transport system substrate-binding protein
MSTRSFRIVLALTFVIAVFAAPTVMAQDELVFPVGEGDFQWEGLMDFADEYDLSGQELSIFGPWLSVDQDLAESMLAYFEWATGADIIYAGSDSFEQQIVIDIEGGSPPNIAVFPQPGLASDMAARGGLVPLGEDLHDWMVENYAAGESWADLGVYADENGDEQFFGFAYKVDLKSLVWYVPDNFADAGYEIPETMEDLIALSEQMVEDGNVPWCIGLGSGDATGWPATDWMEDIMLRTQPPEVYDQWVTNEIPFTDPAVINAMNIFGMFAKNDAWVDGGAEGVATTDFRDSPAGLFTVPPRCYMHRQASFIPSFFPEDTEAMVDWSFFYFPAYESEDLGRPILGAGTIWTITNDSEAAHVFMDFLTLPVVHEIWMGQSGFLTPHKGVSLDAYATDLQRGMGEIMLNATTFRFDASDLMPGAIGAGSFWTGMVDFVSGASAEEVAQTIQESWDAIKED